jgi:hypothetical protein
MEGIGVGSLVIAHCSSPREKLWGEIIRLDETGLVMRGLELESFEDWLRQERSGSEKLIGPTTFFIPMHRIQRLDLDESSLVVSGYGERFAEVCGRAVHEALMEGRGSEA